MIYIYASSGCLHPSIHSIPFGERVSWSSSTMCGLPACALCTLHAADDARKKKKKFNSFRNTSHKHKSGKERSHSHFLVYIYSVCVNTLSYAESKLINLCVIRKDNIFMVGVWGSRIQFIHTHWHTSSEKWMAHSKIVCASCA